MSQRGSIVAPAVVRIVGLVLLLVAVAQLVRPLRGHQAHDPLLVAVVVAVLLGGTWLLRRWGPARPVPRSLAIPWNLASVAALAAGLHAWAIWYPAGWDAGALRAMARAVGRADPLSSDQAAYLSHYPNNLPVLDALLVVQWLRDHLGIPAAVSSAVVTGLGTGIVVLVVASLLSTRCGSLRSPTTWTGVGASLVTLLLVGLNPWTSVMYSDQLALAFPAMVVWLAARAGAARTVPAALALSAGAGACAGVGGSIKATVLVMVVAVVLGALVTVQASSVPRRLAVAAVVAAVVSCLGTAAVAPRVWRAASGVSSSIDDGRRMPLERWVWVGLTPTERPDGTVVPGTYSSGVDAVVLPLGIADARAVSRDRALARVRELGPWGLVRWEVDKVRWNLCDGMFTAYGEGGDAVPAAAAAREAPPRELVARWLSAPGGGGYAVRGGLVQGIWLTTLILAGIGCLTVRRERADGLVTALALGVAGILTFTAALEARPRYLLVYAPVVVLLATRTLTADAPSSRPRTEPMLG